MDREKVNPNFDINAKYEEMINVSKRIVEHHEFVTDGTCEPPMFVSLAYDVKNYLPKLLEKNQKQEEVIDKLSKTIYETDELSKTTGGYPSNYIDNLLDILKEVE